MQPTLFPVPVGVGLFMMFFSTALLTAGLSLLGDKKYLGAFASIATALLGYVASITWTFIIGSGGYYEFW